MSKKASERVNLMKENFMKLHEEGKSIAQIAATFGITGRAVYLNLQSIADANGVTRESLLSKPIASYTISKGHGGISKYVDVEELTSTYNTVIMQSELLIEKLDNILQEE